MATVTIFLLCSFVVVFARGQVVWKADRPWLRLKISDPATLECCYESSTGSVKYTWIQRVMSTQAVSKSVLISNQTTFHEEMKEGTSKTFCGKLIFEAVQLNDTGMYQCELNSSNIPPRSHGTYMQVYKPLKKTINLSERTKNRILTVEGFLLFVGVLGPSFILLFKTKKLHELEKKKVNKEEENIYQGLNLDDCCTTYDQIERSQPHGPYEDVCNIIEEEQEEIQLEKP